MKYSRIVHGLSFKLVWVGTILLAAKELEFLAAVLIWGWSGLWWLHPVLRRYSSLAIKSLAVGIVAELVLCYSGVARTQLGEALYFPPFWLLGLWLAFASLLPFCLKGLHHKLIPAAIIGGIFGPLSYNTGSSWGAMHIQNDLWGLAAVGLVWAVSFPALLSQLGAAEEQQTSPVG